MHFRHLILTTTLMMASAAALACDDGQCPYNKKNQWSELLKLEGDKAEQLNELQSQYISEHKALKNEHGAAKNALHQQYQLRLSNILEADEQRLLEQTIHPSGKAHHNHNHSNNADKSGYHAKQCPEHSKTH